jgi:hypothetical protein
MIRNFRHAVSGTDQPEDLGVADELYFEYRESVPVIEDAAPPPPIASLAIDVTSSAPTRGFRRCV